jgi:hypothetical protein
MTDLRYFVPALVIIAILGITYYFVGDPSTFRIRREITSQLMSELPRTYTSDGHLGNLQGVEITQMTHGQKGYAVSVAIQYDNSTTYTSLELVSDGFGRLSCNTFGQIGPVGWLSLNIHE